MWETPLFTDGLPVQYYIIRHYRTGMELGRTAGNTSSITLRNLYPAINYSIVVLAVTHHKLGRLVEGEISDIKNFTTAMGGKLVVIRNVTILSLRLCSGTAWDYSINLLCHPNCLLNNCLHTHNMKHSNLTIFPNFRGY